MTKTDLMRLLGFGLVLHVLFTTSLFAQNPNTTDGLKAIAEKNMSPHLRVYGAARELGDYETAITALHYLLLEDPENAFLQDSLAVFYLRTGKMESCKRQCQRILDNNPQHKFIRELAANAALQTGDLESSLLHYEALYAIEKSHFYRYQASSLQYQMGRYGECGANVGAMLSDPQIDEVKVHIDWGNGGGDIPLRAALLNLRGNLELALNQENDARKSWRQALKLDKSFLLPRYNLNALQQKEMDERDDRGR